MDAFRYEGPQTWGQLYFMLRFNEDWTAVQKGNWTKGPDLTVTDQGGTLHHLRAHLPLTFSVQLGARPLWNERL